VLNASLALKIKLYHKHHLPFLEMKHYSEKILKLGCSLKLRHFPSCSPRYTLRALGER
jgi:hypothetical protein